MKKNFLTKILFLSLGLCVGTGVASTLVSINKPFVAAQADGPVVVTILDEPAYEHNPTITIIKFSGDDGMKYWFGVNCSSLENDVTYTIADMNIPCTYRYSSDYSVLETPSDATFCLKANGDIEAMMTTSSGVYMIYTNPPGPTVPVEYQGTWEGTVDYLFQVTPEDGTADVIVTVNETGCTLNFGSIGTYNYDFTSLGDKLTFNSATGRLTIQPTDGKVNASVNNADYLLWGNLTFTPLITTYTITNGTTDSNGTIEIDKESAEEGDLVTVTVNPAGGYELDSLAYNDGDSHEITKDATSGNYQFYMPEADVTVVAEFKEHTHSMSEKWSYDANYHWHKCTIDGCTHIEDKAEHQFEYLDSPKKPTCTEKGTDRYKCVCGAIITKPTDPLGHSFGDEFEYDETQHWHKCIRDNCDEITEKEDHVYDQKVATDDYLCSPATCTAPATYYMSCVCGAKGTETFSSGDPLGHDFGGEVTYTWNDETHECTASWKCQHEGCNETQSETVTGIYVCDTPATCLENEKGHYEATFTISGFEKQSTAANSVVKPDTALSHDFGGEVTYTWNDETHECTASWKCQHEGCNETQSETVTGIYVKDFDATCTANEKGHYEATFTVDGFEKQETLMFDVPNTAKGHDYTITYTWNENHTKCTANAECSHGDSSITEEATITIEDGYAVATFEDEVFETQRFKLPEKTGLSGGAIAGIVIGSLFGLIIIAFVVLYILWKHKNLNVPLVSKVLTPVFRWINNLLFKGKLNNVEMKVQKVLKESDKKLTANEVVELLPDFKEKFVVEVLTFLAKEEKVLVTGEGENVLYEIIKNKK